MKTILVIEDQDPRIRLDHLLADFFQLAGTYIGGRINTLDGLHCLADNLDSGRFGKLPEF